MNAPTQTISAVFLVFFAACRSSDGASETVASGDAQLLEDTVDVMVAGDAPIEDALDAPSEDLLSNDVGFITDIEEPSDLATDGASTDVTVDATIEADAVNEGPFVYVTSLSGEGGTGTEDDPYHDLQTALDEAPDGATVVLQPGTYNTSPQPYDDPGCGNCDDFTFYGGAEATRGFLVTGKSLHLQGGGTSLTILHVGPLDLDGHVVARPHAIGIP